jgi:hypothetical protein
MGSASSHYQPKDDQVVDVVYRKVQLKFATEKANALGTGLLPSSIVTRLFLFT